MVGGKGWLVGGAVVVGGGWVGGEWWVGGEGWWWGIIKLSSRGIVGHGKPSGGHTEASSHAQILARSQNLVF